MSLLILSVSAMPLSKSVTPSHFPWIGWILVGIWVLATAFTIAVGWFLHTSWGQLYLFLADRWEMRRAGEAVTSTLPPWIPPNLVCAAQAALQADRRRLSPLKQWWTARRFRHWRIIRSAGVPPLKTRPQSHSPHERKTI
ncbi:MAG: hypothetical protein OWS74_01380 [Firmicutes bacterium]|nr:hypothetical protein [Bacillota bacterium]